MEDIFEMLTVAEKEKIDTIGLRLGVRIKIAGHETTCPISKICNSYEALEIEVQALKNHLERIMNGARNIFSRSSIQGGLDIRPDMTPEQVWTILSNIADEKLFVDSFNSIDEIKRREIAEHVLTECNIFSDKASTFSSRYNNESGLME